MTFELTVVDYDGVNDTDSVDISVNNTLSTPPINHSPAVADKSASTTTNIPVRINLSGTDIDSDVLSFQYRLISTSGSISEPETINIFRTVINASKETPPNGSPGTGLGAFKYNQTSKSSKLFYQLYRHLGAPAVPGPIQFPLQSGNIKSGIVGPFFYRNLNYLMGICM